MGVIRDKEKPARAPTSGGKQTSARAQTRFSEVSCPGKSEIPDSAGMLPFQLQPGIPGQNNLHWHLRANENATVGNDRVFGYQTLKTKVGRASWGKTLETLISGQAGTLSWGAALVAAPIPSTRPSNQRHDFRPSTYRS